MHLPFHGQSTQEFRPLIRSMSGLLPYSKARGSKSGCDRPQRRGEATWDSRQSAFFVYRPSYRIGFSFLPPKLEKKGALSFFQPSFYFKGI